MVLLLALVPAVVFVTLSTLTAGSEVTGDFGEWRAFLPWVLTFISLPALLPLAAARTKISRSVALGLVCAVAAITGVLVATTDDAQAGFTIFLNLYFAPPIAVLVRLGEWILWESRPAGDREWAPASVGDRLTALALDVALLWAICFLPFSALKDHGAQMEAGAFLLVVGTTYFGVSLLWRQRTIGQAVMSLAVVDAETFGPLGAVRAALRGLITTVEIGGTAVLLLAPVALADFASAAWFGGRSLTDRMCGTLVIAQRPVERTGSGRIDVEGA